MVPKNVGGRWTRHSQFTRKLWKETDLLRQRTKLIYTLLANFSLTVQDVLAATNCHITNIIR